MGPWVLLLRFLFPTFFGVITNFKLLVAQGAGSLRQPIKVGLRLPSIQHYTHFVNTRFESYPHTKKKGLEKPLEKCSFFSFRIDTIGSIKTQKGTFVPLCPTVLRLLNTIRTSIQEDKTSKFYYFGLKRFMEQGA